METKTKVGVVMGSDSDLPVMSQCLEALEKLKLPYEVQILSAHRLPDETAEFARSAAKKGFAVIIAGAGGAAHLGGVIAALTPLPVIAVPLSSPSLGGVDSLYSMVQMPRGIPVATVAVDGAYNAGVLAAKIIGATNLAVRARVEEFKKELAQKVNEKNMRLQQSGYKKYLENM